MNLTKNFTLAEFTRSATADRLGIKNAPPNALLGELTVTAKMLERIREMLKVPVIITSGYRCAELNAAVGGRTSSDHTQGHAADFIAPAFGTPTKVASFLGPMVEALEIGQLILEGIQGKQWVHVSTQKPAKPINRVITITDAGTVAGIVGLA